MSNLVELLMMKDETWGYYYLIFTSSLIVVVISFLLLYNTTTIYKFLYPTTTTNSILLPRSNKPIKIGILGSGVGGTSAAFSLYERIPNNVDLTIIEQTDRIGGRCKVIECPKSKERFEAGASIVSDLNEVFKTTMEQLNLKRIKGKVHIPLFIHNGNETDNPWIVVSPTSIPLFDRLLSLHWKLKILDVIGTFQIVWKYGFRKLRSLKTILTKEPKNTLKFDKLYQHLESGSYRTPEEIVLEICYHDVDKYDRLMTNSAQIAIFGESKKTPIITDFVDTGARCNYGGQDCDDLHGFVGLVSLAGGIASKCFAVEGGNERVPQGLIQQLMDERGTTNKDKEDTTSSDTKNLMKGQFQILLNTTCTEVKKREKEGGYEVTIEQQGERRVEHYDIVLCCSPIERSSVKFIPNIPSLDAWMKKSHKLRRCVTTFVRGILNPDMYPNNNNNDDTVFPILEVLTTSKSNLPIYSLTVKIPCTLSTTKEIAAYLSDKYQKQNETQDPQFVYKLFSPDILTKQEYNRLFVKWETITTEDWYAYPEYKIPQDFLPFVLEESSNSLLLYGNAIEQVAGAMEMSMISGRNLANLAAEWVQKNWQEEN